MKFNEIDTAFLTKQRKDMLKTFFINVKCGHFCSLSGFLHFMGEYLNLMEEFHIQ